MGKTPAFVFFLCVILTASSSMANGLTVYCEYPPPAKVEIGDLGGLIYDQVRALLQRTAQDEDIQVVTWKRGYAEATTKADVGLFPTTRTPEREPLFHWIGPIHRVEWVLYAHADSKLTINSLEDAKKVTAIGTYANDGKESWLKKQGFTNLVSVMDNLTNMRKLYDRRIDLMAGSPSSTGRWPEQFGFDPTKLEVVYTIKSVDLYLALSRDTSMDLVWKLQKEFNKMSKDGTVSAIYSKWAPFLTPPPVRQ